MVLLYDGAPHDPRIRRLSASAHWFWIALIGVCSSRRRDTLAIDELDTLFASHPDVPQQAVIDELVAAELAQLLPHGHIRALAHLDLWAFEDELER